MILSIGLILILGFIGGFLLSKIKLPGLVAMIIVGIVIGPYCLDWIDQSILDISSYLRQIALVIILTRSGLNLDIKTLKKVGRPAILMCFIPATLEIAGAAFAAYFLLDLKIFECLLLGSTLAAVSPAVVSPRMIKLIDEGYGKTHSVPEIVLAGSSVDDIFVIVLFYAFLGIVQNDVLDIKSISLVPLTIVSGVILGIGVGYLISLLFKKTNFKVGINILITLSVSFLLIGLENWLDKWFDISALLAIMVMGMVLLFRNHDKAKELSNGYNNLWLFFEIILFVLVGATVDLKYAADNSLMAILVILIGLSFRTIGVVLCLIKTELNLKERLFVIVSYIAKATVQASIGGIALSKGLSCGSIILTVSVLSILITAPVGAILIDNLGKRWLEKEEIVENIA